MPTDTTQAETAEASGTETSETVHTTVLLHESIEGLDIHPSDIYLDGTLGGAGHAVYALQVCPDITIVGIDEDEAALARAQARLEKVRQEYDRESKSTIILAKGNFRNLGTILDSHNIASVNRIMLDLGLSSDQFEVSGRGFSFKKEEPLLMNFGTTTFTARDIVNTWEEEHIADVIYGYGEETYSRKIAKGIVEARSKKPIETTTDLVNIILASTPSRYHHGRTHPATKTFQALRITVNDEINALREVLTKGFNRLAPRGRMAVISFHSIEDRIVKHFYKLQDTGDIITKKPITPSDQEISENPRSRSAKLRIIEKHY